MCERCSRPFVFVALNACQFEFWTAFTIVGDVFEFPHQKFLCLLLQSFSYWGTKSDFYFWIQLLIFLKSVGNVHWDFVSYYQFCWGCLPGSKPIGRCDCHIVPLRKGVTLLYQEHVPLKVTFWAFLEFCAAGTFSAFSSFKLLSAFVSGREKNSIISCL